MTTAVAWSLRCSPQQAADFVKVLLDAYPDASIRNPAVYTTALANVLARESYETAKKAVQVTIETNKKIPTVAHLVEAIETVRPKPTTRPTYVTAENSKPEINGKRWSEMTEEEKTIHNNMMKELYAELDAAGKAMAARTAFIKYGKSIATPESGGGAVG